MTKAEEILTVAKNLDEDILQRMKEIHLLENVSKSLDAVWEAMTLVDGEVEALGDARNCSEVMQEAQSACLESLLEKRKEAMDLIRRVENPFYRYFLEQVYLCGKDKKETAKAMGYDEHHAGLVQHNALQICQRILKKNEKEEEK